MISVTLVPMALLLFLSSTTTQAFHVPRHRLTAPSSLWLTSSQLFLQQQQQQEQEEEGDSNPAALAREWTELYAPTVVIRHHRHDNKHAAPANPAAEENWATQWQELQELNAAAHTAETHPEENHHQVHNDDKKTKTGGVHALTPDGFPGEYESSEPFGSSSRQALQANPANIKPWKHTTSSMLNNNNKNVKPWKPSDGIAHEEAASYKENEPPMIITHKAPQEKQLRLAKLSRRQQQQQYEQESKDQPLIITHNVQEKKPLRLAEPWRQPNQRTAQQQQYEDEEPMIITHNALEEKPLRLAEPSAAARQYEKEQQQEEEPMIITHNALDEKPLRLAQPSAAARQYEKEQQEEEPMIITHNALGEKPLRFARRQPQQQPRQQQNTVPPPSNLRDEYMGPVLHYHSGGWHDAIAESWEDVELSRRAAEAETTMSFQEEEEGIMPGAVESFDTAVLHDDDVEVDTMVAETAVVAPPRAAFSMPQDYPSTADSSPASQGLPMEQGSPVAKMPQAFVAPSATVKETTTPSTREIPPPKHQGIEAASTVTNTNQVAAAAAAVIQDNSGNTMQSLADAWTQRNKAPAEESSSSGMPPSWGSATTAAPNTPSSWPKIPTMSSRVLETAQQASVIQEESTPVDTTTPEEISSLQGEEKMQDLAQVASSQDTGSLEMTTPKEQPLAAADDDEEEEEEEQPQLAATLSKPTATSQAADQVEAAVNALLESNHDEVMLEEAGEQFEDAVQALMTAIDDKVGETQPAVEMTTSVEGPDEDLVTQEWPIENAVQEDEEEEEEEEAVVGENLVMQNLSVENTVPEKPQNQAPKPRKVIWNREFAASLPTENFSLTMNFQTPDDDEAARRSAAAALKRLRRAVESIPVPPFRDLKQKRALFAGTASTLLATFLGMNTMAAMVNHNVMIPEPATAAPLEEPVLEQAQVVDEEAMDSVVQMKAEETIITEAEAFQPRLTGDMSET